MKVEGVSPDGKTKVTFDSKTISQEFIAWARGIEITDESLRKMIDGLQASADVKALLYSFAKATVVVGAHVVKIGRKVLDVIMKLFSEFPKVGFGLIFGALVSILVSSIPVLGVVLGPLVTPIALGLGLILGLKEDLADNELKRRVDEAAAGFAILKD